MSDVEDKNLSSVEDENYCCSIVTYGTLCNYPYKHFFLDEEDSELFKKYKPNEIDFTEKELAGWNNYEDVKIEYSLCGCENISKLSYCECRFVSNDIDELMDELYKYEESDDSE